MGARASITFKRGGDKSPCLCQHWGGPEFHEEVREWVTGLYADREAYVKAKTQAERDDIAAKYKSEGRNFELMSRIDEVGRVFLLACMNFGDGGYVGLDRSEVDDSDFGCLVISLEDKGPKFSLNNA